ncbi:MAG TPA: hypothetical protein VLX68_04525 [Chitinivibrionales bacterium]|nr:hypothetical protein [Chitinivibrionales bacterium]
MSKKRTSRKKSRDHKTFGSWTISCGELIAKQGRPGKKDQTIFKAFGEKIPWNTVNWIKHILQENKLGTEGIYIAHDSMGIPRYIGRGAIFSRLAARFKAHPI